MLDGVRIVKSRHFPAGLVAAIGAEAFSDHPTETHTEPIGHGVWVDPLRVAVARVQSDTPTPCRECGGNREPGDVDECPCPASAQEDHRG